LSESGEVINSWKTPGGRQEANTKLTVRKEEES